MKILRFGETYIAIEDDSTLIRTPIGDVPAVPEDTDDYRRTAERLGYGADTLTMCKEHEVTHLALCHWLGVTSPVIAGLTGDRVDAKLHGLEEDAVLAIQRFARAVGIDLVQHFDAKQRH